MYHSEVLDVGEELRVPQPTHQFVSIFHVGYVVLDAAVEYVLQGVFAHELEAQDAHCLAECLVSPEVADLLDGVYVAPTVIDEVVEIALV